MHQIVCRLGFCPRPTGGAYIAGLGVGPRGTGRSEGRDGKGGEGAPECPNPELASLDVSVVSAATADMSDIMDSIKNGIEKVEEITLSFFTV